MVATYERPALRGAHATRPLWHGYQMIDGGVVPLLRVRIPGRPGTKKAALTRVLLLEALFWSPSSNRCLTVAYRVGVYRVGTVEWRCELVIHFDSVSTRFRNGKMLPYSVKSLEYRVEKKIKGDDLDVWGDSDASCGSGGHTHAHGPLPRFAFQLFWPRVLWGCCLLVAIPPARYGVRACLGTPDP